MWVCLGRLDTRAYKTTLRMVKSGLNRTNMRIVVTQEAQTRPQAHLGRLGCNMAVWKIKITWLKYTQIYSKNTQKYWNFKENTSSLVHSNRVKTNNAEQNLKPSQKRNHKSNEDRRRLQRSRARCFQLSNLVMANESAQKSTLTAWKYSFMTSELNSVKLTPSTNIWNGPSTCGGNLLSLE